MSVGSTLAEARERRGLTVEAVSEATRIRSGLIRDIEADRFDACGGEVYARGHIRSIARVVGIDPEPLVAEFDAAHHIEAPPVLTAAPLETDREALAHSERRGPNWPAAMIVALLVIIAAAAYGLASGGGKSPSPVQAGQSAPTVPSPVVSTPAPSRSTGPSVAQLPPNKAILLIKVLPAASGGAPCWISVTDLATGVNLWQGTLQPGQQRRFTSTSALSYTIGNAPAVDLVVNGKDVGSPQPPGGGVVARGVVHRGSHRIAPA